MIQFEKLPYPLLIAGHIILTIFMIAVPFLIPLFFYASIIYFGLRVLLQKDSGQEALLACAYLVTLEVFLRMNQALIFYEFMKYLVIVFMIMGIIMRGFSLKSIPYVFYLLLLIPSIIVAAGNIPLGESLRKAVAFNLSGPVTLGITAIYCYQRSITNTRLDQILKLCVGPVVMITTYLFLVTPDIRDVVTNTASNFATSGGYGPNQVATVLGIGMFITFVRFLRIKNLMINVLDIVLFLAMTYRAWVTFSRGGVYTSFLMIIAVIGTLFLLKRSEFKVSFIPKLAVIALGLIMAWGFTSLVTNGLIDKRYANEDAAGRAKDDLSTGRTELISIELEAFFENPIAGIGAGQVKYYRAKKDGIIAASHNETSRLLSEHGAIGIFSLLVLIFTPLFFRLFHRGNIYFYAFLIFWIATINHSAMRIAAPAFFYGLALLYVRPVKAKNKKQLESNTDKVLIA
ncbi:O-antigen ligase family protein [Nonlabens mediterrranea]|uniref:O-antigen ligase family protein n=1 Tax=Nonlabens mediterrranea TaxID=1419947 RepID=A0ABS0A541_9FLAO|nr:O-antigen ligase family protein [Nonlabens mediterrranea]